MFRQERERIIYRKETAHMLKAVFIDYTGTIIEEGGEAVTIRTHNL